MAEGDTFRVDDPDGYAAKFGDIGVDLTITGAGDFQSRLTRLKLKHVDIYRCYENLPRIAYISLPAEPVFLSFPVGNASHLLDGFALQAGDMVAHGRGGHMHQRTSGECQWGLLSLPAELLAKCSKALTGRPITSPSASRILRPFRGEALRLQRLFAQACRLAASRRRLIDSPEVVRALEQQMLHAIVHCLAGNEADDNRRTRHHHAALMVRFEETLNECIEQKLSLPSLCAKIGVPERTLRLCCVEFLGLSPTRYLLLRRLNKVRAALRRGARSTTSVAEVARNHQFLELGRFAVTYRAAFGESPSVTLQRNPQP